MIAEDAVEEVRSYLEGDSGQTLNLIYGALDTTTTTVTFQRAIDGITSGTLLSVGLETMYVWEADAAARTATVRRGHGTSTARTHSDGDLVRVRPLVPAHRIFDALNAELDALSGDGLFRIATLDLTAATSARSYDLADDLVSVYEVRVDTAGDDNSWPLLNSWRLDLDAPVSEFPSGRALRVDRMPPAGRTVRVVYHAAFMHLTSLADDMSTATGLQPTAVDIPALGAAWRLSAPGEVIRNRTDRQGDPRRAEEVGPGAKLRAPLPLAQQYERRVRQERNRLYDLHPMKDRR